MAVFGAQVVHNRDPVILQLVLSLGPTDEQLVSWGSRIPFVASGLLVAVGLYVRLRLAESDIFQNVLDRQAQARIPTGTSVSSNVGALLGGALAPITATWALSETGGAWWSLSVYVLAISLVALACILALPDTTNATLAEPSSAAGATIPEISAVATKTSVSNKESS